MTKSVKFRKIAFAGIIVGALCGLLYWFLTYVPPEARREMTETDRIIASTDVMTDKFAVDIQDHRQQVIERTVMIREKIQADIDALDADGLARVALAEIELWRGSSGDHPPPRSSGMDI